MKIVLSIARTELRNMFYSPVAWFTTIIFLLVCSIFYTGTIETFANLQDSMQKNSPGWSEFHFPLTKTVFLSQFIVHVFNNLYYFIPLLTMGLINRDFNYGTVKLFYSSPVKLNKIIWGKYVAVMAYNMLLLSIVLIFMVIGEFNIKNLDWGHLCTILLAFYLITCTYTAIGLFMSSITNYQIVSAIATFTILFVLQKIGGIFQEVDFFRDLTYFLSINGRTEKMIMGLVTTSDVMYYLLITSLFIAFTYLCMLHGRQTVSTFMKTIRYISVFMFVILAGYLTSRPGFIGYWDGTATQSNTINEKTQQILKNFGDEPLEVTLYTNLLDHSFNKARPSARNYYVWGLWDKYIRFNPNIEFKYVLYYDVKEGDSTLYKMFPKMTLEEIARESAKMSKINFDRFIGPEEIKTQVDFQSEDRRALIQVKYKDKRIFLRTFNDEQFWPDEMIVAAGMKRLLVDSVPRVYALNANLERSLFKTGEREFHNFSLSKKSRTALINHGFEFDTLNLTTQEIPSDAVILMLSDPKTKLHETVLNKLNNYIQTGGNLLILGEPGKQDVINPFLHSVGAKLLPGTLVQLSKNEMPHMVLPAVTLEHAHLYQQESKFTVSQKAQIPTGRSMHVLHPGAAALSHTDSVFKISSLMATSPGKTWVKAGHLVIDSATPVLDVREGDYIYDSFNVALALQREINNKEQRIVIGGDADFTSNVRSSNKILITNYLSWLTYESFPIHFLETAPIDTVLTISLKTAEVQYIALVWLLPSVLLVCGTIILLRRKRQ